MKSTPGLRAGTAVGSLAKPPPRRLPRWLRQPGSVQAMARSRCLVLLSVLSGELCVSEAIAQAKISRATYYHLEKKALAGMLQALQPDLKRRPRTSVPPESRLARLIQENRRLRRLLNMSRKATRMPLTTGCRGRLPGKRLRSSPAGSDALPPLPRKGPLPGVCREAAPPTRGPGDSSR